MGIRWPDHSSKSPTGYRAQGCIVSSKLVSRLGLNVQPSADEAVGIGGLNVPDIRGQTNFEFALGSTCTGFSYLVSAVVLDEVVGKLLRKKVLQETGLVAVDTTGGYVVFGPVWRPQDLPEGDPVLYGSVLSEVLQRFWESEEPPTADRRKPEDDECELFYQYNTARCSSGRFVTRLPFLPNRPALVHIGGKEFENERMFQCREFRLFPIPVLLKYPEYLIPVILKLTKKRRHRSLEGKWRCPACQNTSEEVPAEYWCMCGARRSPEQCGCGADTRTVLCSDKAPLVCGRVCNRLLACGVHTCVKECHEGPCGDCTEVVIQVCYCEKKEKREVACTPSSSGVTSWSCGAPCSFVLACGAHLCKEACHPPPCPPCARSPDTVRACPCGHTKLSPDSRKKCTDPIPTCDNICLKPLTCGPPDDKHFCKQTCHNGNCNIHSIYSLSSIPTCDNICLKPLTCGPPDDKHFCKQTCHNGECPVCPDKTLIVCRCKNATREVPCAELPDMDDFFLCQKKCNKKLSCGRHRCRAVCCADKQHRCGVVCGRYLACGLHRCEQFCHTGHCAPCPRLGNVTLSYKQHRCGVVCGRYLACGLHRCEQFCHTGHCAPCPRLGNVTLSYKQHRCGVVCGRYLACGLHRCEQFCHTGHCAPCPRLGNVTLSYKQHRCGVVCGRYLACGLHRCEQFCHTGHCAPCPRLGNVTLSYKQHRCGVVCGRYLACGLHRCEQFCHTGHCAPCPRLEFQELSCECGAEVLLPPIACGTKPPACSAPCRRQRACGHPPHHSCHSGDCPPCVVLTTKMCHGQHEERKTIPCSQEEFSCGLPCGKPLPCGKHTCIKTCHKGPCDTGKCMQPCTVVRPSCGHPCAAPCHADNGGACPSTAPCKRTVRATCPCARKHADRTCADNSRDRAKILSALAASKVQEGGTVDISEMRPSAMLKTLECDDECRVEARTRQLALALQIRNPDVSSKLAPRYSEHVRATAVKEPAFAQQIHDKLTELVQLAKKSKQKTRSHSFPSMNWARRQFVHELCEQFGCESVAYDAEPNRNVVATADREKSWLPAMSILEVLAREAGKRRIPGPVLRAPAQANNAGNSSANSSSTTANSNPAKLVHHSLYLSVMATCNEHTGSASARGRQAQDPRPRAARARASKQRWQLLCQLQLYDCQSWLPAMSILEVLAREAGKRRIPGPVLRAPAQANNAGNSSANSSSTTAK
ncbi:r3H domain-containing protein [Phthorimaea operculella]|nr:r3H domain-containing protein [Phthorimaea operculella]